MTKILVNNFDKEIKFEDLEKAKAYYEMCDANNEKKDFIGNNWESYHKEYNHRANLIRSATSLEELAAALNYMSDIFDNGSQWYVKAIE